VTIDVDTSPWNDVLGDVEGVVHIVDFAYYPVIKHGNGKSPKFIDGFPSYTHPFIGNFPYMFVSRKLTWKIHIIFSVCKESRLSAIGLLSFLRFQSSNPAKQGTSTQTYPK
jgi:hypothetical protein